ncbi:MAG: hypothetical protein JO323_06875 [Acidobacteriia bacterium]|nr:hypothetical protein [Terriglobia bacterium]
MSLPFEHVDRDRPLTAWLAGVRPVLMFSYWLNWKLWGDGPASYHAFNILVHAINTVLVFLVLWRLLTWAGWETKRIRWTAAVGSLIFLIHPLQTEAVSYVAGRSESLAMLLVLLAYSAYLWRRHESISWLESFVVLILFGLALATKENAICLAGLIVFTDLFWPKPFSLIGLRRNWRLYALMLPAAALGAGLVLHMLAGAPSAGFSLRTYTWYQYAFTQAGVIFSYVRMALLPAGLSVDHDYPPSHTIFENGAIFWIALLIAVTVLALRFRRRYPVACFGWFFFLIVLAPTSSFVPINDAQVERRMYLPLAGLILIGAELSRQIRIPARAAWILGGVAIVLLGADCYARNQEWSHPEDVLGAAAMHSTRNFRPYLNVVQVLFHEDRCNDAVPYMKRAEELFPADPQVQITWAWIFECMKQPEKGLERLQTVAKKQSYARLYEWIGLLYGEMNRLPEAGEALRKAVALDPRSESAHEALALWYEANKNFAAAELEYQTSVGLDPYNQSAQAGLIRARAQAR